MKRQLLHRIVSLKGSFEPWFVDNIDEGEGMYSISNWYNPNIKRTVFPELIYETPLFIFDTLLYKELIES